MLGRDYGNLKELPDACPRLRRLQLEDSAPLAVDVGALARLQHLEVLGLWCGDRSSHIRGNVPLNQLHCLARLARLRWLRLSVFASEVWPIGGGGGADLSGMTGLTRLSLQVGVDYGGASTNADGAPLPENASREEVFDAAARCTTAAIERAVGMAVTAPALRRLLLNVDADKSVYLQSGVFMRDAPMFSSHALEALACATALEALAVGHPGLVAGEAAALRLACPALSQLRYVNRQSQESMPGLLDAALVDLMKAGAQELDITTH